MENARDSSMWRSLAVAFGDGLAFGVGMKLTQNVARQPGMPHSGAADSADRIDRIEQRIDRLDHTPIAALEAAPAPEPAGFARKVIETVVQAVDERLNEHAKQMDLRLAALETRIAEVRSQFIAEIVAVHNRVEGDMRGFAESEGQLREEIQRVADRASSFDVSAAEAVIETKLVPLRVEITEMRQRLAESDRSVLDLILAIGQMCRQAAARIADSAPLPPESAPPPSDTEPPLKGTGDSPGAAPEEPAVPTDPPFESSAPSFTQMKKATSLWRVPAVSSFLLATGGLLLLHYL
jgi:phage shock protein A